MRDLHTSAPSGTNLGSLSPPTTITSQTLLQPQAPRPSNNISATPYTLSQTIYSPTVTQIASKVLLVPKPEEICPPQAGLKPDGFWVITVRQEVGIFYHWADVAECTNLISRSAQKCYLSFQEALKVYTVKFNEGSVHAVPIPGDPFWPSSPSPSLSVESDEMWSQVDDLSETMSQFGF
ncbi:hypothetical protein BDR06DRAFT_1015439 [Suillus hirtellus]|nr:hypothetical protein BDR06DRAFT_1015439 [Suillus hirtellus]